MTKDELKAETIKIGIEYREKIEILQEYMRISLEDLFKNIFLSYPTIDRIKWEQYTPYFNDGDLCEFSAHIDYADITFKEENKVNSKISVEVTKVLSSISEDVLELVFGDHVEITVINNDTLEINIEDFENHS